MKKIIFKARSKAEFEIYDKPIPASQYIPEWWRNMTPYDISPENPEGKKVILNNRTSNATAKKCTPMLDGLTSGYIIPLWADVQISQNNGFPQIAWKTLNNVFELHGQSSKNVLPPPGYSSIVFKYLNCWIPITPKGYSTMITAPAGYQDLPFKAIPAVVDTDRSSIVLVFPMWIKDGFEGIVERGTPMVQLTPFKREDWQSEFSYYENGEYAGIIEEKGFNRTIVNNYIKHHWSKKTYK